jgi:hypothetical protein
VRVLHDPTRPALPRVHHDHGLAVRAPLDRHHPRAEIRLSDAPSVGRHLHVLDVRVAHRKNRVVRQPKEWERKERFHPVA